MIKSNFEKISEPIPHDQLQVKCILKICAHVHPFLGKMCIAQFVLNGEVIAMTKTLRRTTFCKYCRLTPIAYAIIEFF